MKTMPVFSLLVSIFLINLLPVHSFALTEVSGEVEGEWTVEESPYLLTDDVIVPNRESLTIEPGVEILAFEETPLIVLGQLIAEGTEQDSIYFLPAEAGGNWRGLIFHNADRGTILDYCEISYGLSGFGEDEELFSGGNILIQSGEVTIKNSKIFEGYASGLGGGIALFLSDALIENCEIYNNISDEAGGGISVVESSHAEIIDCKFINNSAEWGGGGIIIGADSDPIITDCYFEENYAEVGGAVNVGDGSSPLISHSKFVRNSAAFAAGMFLSEEECEPLVEWCDFISNDVAENQGGEHGWGGAVILDEHVSAEIRYCRFLYNSAIVGGGIAVWGAPNSSVHHNLFYKNSARAGGALATGEGGEGNWFELVNCTFIDNDGEPEESNVAIILEGGRIDFNSCIIWGPEPHFWHPERVRVEYSNIRFGWNGRENSEENPELFPMDSTWCVLTAESPCINTGDPDLDRDGDDTRTDRGWMYYPENAMDGLQVDTVYAELSQGSSVISTIDFRNETDAVILTTPVETWREGNRVQIVNVSSITDDNEIQGVAFADGKYFLTGGNSGDDPNQIYVLDDEFDLLENYDQPRGDDGDGFLGMGSDGGNFLYAGDEEYITEFALDGEFGTSFFDPAEFEKYNAVGIDVNFSEFFFDAYLGGNEGVVVRTNDEFWIEERYEVGSPVLGIGTKGSARMVYVMVEPKPGDAVLHSLDPESGVVAPLFKLDTPGEGYSPGGMEITQDMNDGKGTIVGVWKGEGNRQDKLYVFDIYTVWLSVAPEWKAMKPGDEFTWDIGFHAENVETGVHMSEFYLLMNGSGDDGEVNAKMTVHDALVEGSQLPVPDEIRISAVYPNPFNDLSRFSYYLPVQTYVNVRIFDIQGRAVNTVVEGNRSSGSHFGSLDANSLPAGGYFLELSSANGRTTVPFTVIK